MICYCPVQSVPCWRPHSALMPMWCRAAGSTCTRMAATVRCSATRRRSTSVTLRRSDLSCPECHGAKSTGGSCLHRCAFRLTIPALRIPSSIFWCSVRQKQWSLCRRSSITVAQNPKGTYRHQPAPPCSRAELLDHGAAAGAGCRAGLAPRCPVPLQPDAAAAFGFRYATISGLPQETQQAVFRLCCSTDVCQRRCRRISALPRRACWGARRCGSRTLGCGAATAGFQLL